MAMTQRPSGWYDDPNDETLLRYWDGVLWSDKTMPKLMPGLKHVGEALPEDERPKREEIQRRDGEPREYDAHWGPEVSDNRQPYGGPLGGHNPSAQPGSRQQAPQFAPAAAARKGDIAGLGARFIAALIDNFLVSTVATIIALIASPSWRAGLQEYFNDTLAASQAGGQLPDIPDAVANVPFTAVIIPIVAMWLYELLFTMFGGRTLGKRMLGLQVVAADATAAPGQLPTGKLTFGQALVRSLTKWGAELFKLVGAGLLATLVELGLLASANATATKQGLHDRLAKTVVRRTR